MLALGFVQSAADPSMYFLRDAAGLVLCVVYVDDSIIAGSTLAAVQRVIDGLQRYFACKDQGEPELFLNIRVTRDKHAGTLTLSQAHVIRDLVARFGLDAARPRDIPMATGVHLARAQPTDSALSHNADYGSLLGSMNYLACVCRPDIAYAVGVLARFTHAPTQKHWDVAKNLLRYLAATADHGITYGAADGLQGYTDADYGGDTDDRRSTTGFVFTLHGGAISWSSKLQPTIAASTVEAEYQAQGAATRDALHLRKLLPELGFPIGPSAVAITIRADNKGAIALSKNPIVSNRSKHIDTIHHIVRERTNRGEVAFSYISSKENAADCFTKALGAPALRKLLPSLGFGPPPKSRNGECGGE
jgi:hypothetical protein